jgi:hypothetical protein
VEIRADQLHNTYCRDVFIYTILIFYSHVIVAAEIVSFDGNQGKASQNKRTYLPSPSTCAEREEGVRGHIVLQRAGSQVLRMPPPGKQAWPVGDV